ERLAVLRYCLGQDLADIDLHRYAARLGGTTQATLAKIVADARRAARLSSRPLTETDLEASIATIAPSPTPGALRRACVHEAGHAVMALHEGLPVGSISISSDQDGSAAHIFVGSGYADGDDLTAVRRMARVLLAGRAAEMLILGKVSSGA